MSSRGRGRRNNNRVIPHHRAVEFEIPRLVFQRLVKEIAGNLDPSIRFQTAALRALQEAAEGHIIGKFEDVNLTNFTGGRITTLRTCRPSGAETATTTRVETKPGEQLQEQAEEPARE